MPDLLLYVKASVLSAGASAIVALAFGLWSQRKPRPADIAHDERLARVVAIVSLLVGVFVGYGVLQFKWKWPPANAMERFLEIVFPAVIAIELLSTCVRSPKPTLILRSLLAAACGRILLHNSVYLNPSDADNHATSGLAILLPAAAILAIVWWMMLRLSHRRAASSAVIAMVMSLQAAGIAIMLAGYLKGGAAAIPLVSALIAVVIANSLTRRAIIAPSLTSAAVVSLFSLLFIGRYFGALSSANAVVIFLTPLLCWSTELARTQHWSTTRIGLVRLMLVSAVLLVVLLVARQEFNRRMKPLLSAIAMEVSPK